MVVMSVFYKCTCSHSSVSGKWPCLSQDSGPTSGEGQWTVDFYKACVS